MGRSAFGLKPAYVFKPATLAHRVWIKFFPPSSRQQVVRLPWGSSIEVDPAEVIGGAIFRQRIFDVAVSECAWRLLRSGDHVLDAGANIGYMTSLFAARVGKQGVIHSFEPHPVTCKKLTSNTGRFTQNRASASIIVHECALGDVNGVADLFEPDNFAVNQGAACLANGYSAGQGIARHQVQIKLLDDVIPAGEFGLLKIDVEGHELKLIQGASQLLSQHRVRHVIYEDHTQGKSGIPETLAAHGYTVYSIGHTLFGLKLNDFRQQIVLDTSWESPSYLATLDPTYVNSRITKGWEIFRGRPTADRTHPLAWFISLAAEC
jgi:FkbM family methyltransferase